jgi:hypothetical protein
MFRCAEPWLTGLAERNCKKGDDAESEVLWFVGPPFEPVGHSAELGKRTHIHLSHRPAAVNFHRCFSNAHIAGDLLAEAALHDLKHDIAFPGAQRREALLEGGQSLLIVLRGTIAREAEVNGIEELLIPERLGKEFDGAAFHRLDRHGDIAVSGDEDDRKLPLRCRQLALKIKTALTGQSHVENQAGGASRRIGLEKVGNGREELRVDTDRPQQASNGRTKIGIIVDNQNGGVYVGHCYNPRPGIPGVSLYSTRHFSAAGGKLIPIRRHEQHHFTTREHAGIL